MDGNYDFAELRKSFLMYTDFEHIRGLFEFHHIFTKGDKHGVHSVWNELTGQYQQVECVQDRSNYMGIGHLVV
jgi:hypothetical protein